MLRVDSDSLRALASGLTDRADDISELDPVAVVEPSANAMPQSAFGAAAANTALPILAAYQAMAERIQNMADAATVSAHSYEQAEAAFRAQLTQYLNGR
ncbi:hypothetical protein QMK17_23875 [Rhodococcus sp. G-MC3]|uniref:hypothetical protein n=1 Tax=Rhodococcus sp. G-MC3 TaxID=3046209 RepID=UPI0024B94512|nr:hypothetical protein [Rhodococcus sp. G-MC3]MDJ0396348.1 hypothetical protein [Rhodococcus sp. G-MC3]